MRKFIISLTLLLISSLTFSQDYKMTVVANNEVAIFHLYSDKNILKVSFVEAEDVWFNILHREYKEGCLTIACKNAGGEPLVLVVCDDKSAAIRVGKSEFYGNLIDMQEF